VQIRTTWHKQEEVEDFYGYLILLKVDSSEVFKLESSAKE